MLEVVAVAPAKVRVAPWSTSTVTSVTVSVASAASEPSTTSDCEGSAELPALVLSSPRSRVRPSSTAALTLVPTELLLLLMIAPLRRTSEPSTTASATMSLVEVPLASVPTEVSTAVTVTSTPSRSTSLSSGVVRVRISEKVWMLAAGSIVMVSTEPPSSSSAVTPAMPLIAARSAGSSCHWSAVLEPSRSIAVLKSTTIPVSTSFGSDGSPTEAERVVSVGTSSGITPSGFPVTFRSPPGTSTTLRVSL